MKNATTRCKPQLGAKWAAPWSPPSESSTSSRRLLGLALAVSPPECRRSRQHVPEDAVVGVDEEVEDHADRMSPVAAIPPRSRGRRGSSLGAIDVFFPGPSVATLPRRAPTSLAAAASKGHGAGVRHRLAAAGALTRIRAGQRGSSRPRRRQNLAIGERGHRRRRLSPSVSNEAPPRGNSMQMIFMPRVQSSSSASPPTASGPCRRRVDHPIFPYEAWLREFTPRALHHSVVVRGHVLVFLFAPEASA